MKNRTDKYGLTLIEMLIVVGIIALLTALVIGVARRIDNQSKERLTENTIAIINAALGQFEDYKYDYNDLDYRSFVFPLDCNGFNAGGLLTTLQNATGAAGGTDGIGPVGNLHLNEYSGCEALCYFLNQIPDCRKTLDRINRSLMTSKDSNKQDMSITVGGIVYPLIRVIDPWGKTLLYDYYDETLNLDGMKKSRKTFPVVISAGPDRVFGTSDDVKNK